MRGVVLALAFVGCGAESSPPAEREECENLNPAHCLFPWPTMRYLVHDEATATGFRLSLPLAALPRGESGAPPTIHWWEGLDGISPSTAILTAYPVELDERPLADETRISESVAPDSPTIILDAETGERVPHFAELDHRSAAIPGERAFYLRPAVRLEEDRRYLVATRRLTASDGTPVAPSEYFLALRDDRSTDVDELEERRDSFEEIFSRLEEAGIARGELIEAWDFHTASSESTRGDLTRMRDETLRLASDPTSELRCIVDQIEEEPNEQTWRRIRGRFSTPLFLENRDPGALAHRDAGGQIQQNGLVEAPFHLVIPRSVHAQLTIEGRPARAAVYGHSGFGTGEGIWDERVESFLDRAQLIGIATDHWGMSREDIGTVASMMSDFGNTRPVSERLTQGAINHVALAAAFRRGACTELAELSIDGRRIIDAAEPFHYYGVSQGGSLGITIASLSPDIARVALQVGGVELSLLMSRSVLFRPFDGLLQLSYPDHRDREWLMVALAIPFERSEPVAFARSLGRDANKQVLLQVGRYDAAVPNIASDLAARTLGLGYLPGSVYPPFGMQPVESEAESGYAIYLVPGVEPAPAGLVTSADNDTHSRVPELEAVQHQLQIFLTEGRAVDVCDGPCDPD